MACNGGLLSPTLVKNAMRSFSAECAAAAELGRGRLSAGSSDGSTGRSADAAADGWLRSLSSSSDQSDGCSFIPLAARRVREVSKRRLRAVAVQQGTARPALDSEGDSDISSEGSSGASSLTRSQDSGAGAGRTRLSESSEPENEDELANVNLRQLRSSYLTNFDSTKSSARASHKLDTGVSIKNLKNTYACSPVPAPRHLPAHDARPRDLSKIAVNMASLKSVYSSAEPLEPAAPPRAADVPAGPSLTSIRAAYVQQAQGHRVPTADRPARTIKTGVSIDKLRASYDDLSRLSDECGADAELAPAELAPAGLEPVELAPRPAPRCNSIRDLSTSATDLPGLQASPVPRSWLQAPATARSHVSPAAQDASSVTSPTSLTKSRYRSEGDLRLSSPPRRAAAGPPPPQITDRSSGLRDCDVFSRVSVKALRASFCDLTQLREPPASLGGDLDRLTVHVPTVRSGFGKDEPADHTRIHVRSFDSSKAIQKFSKDPAEAASSQCRSCGRQVFQMERVSAEKAVWHKNCFRCSDCGKQVTVDTYASDEGRLYCVVHHRQLMKDRAAGHVEDSAPRTPVRGDMVVHAEPQPDLPAADVVRSSNKADYGLDDLQNLNVKDRFSVFERHNDDQERGPASVEVKRSQSILNKMKKFQDRGQPRDNGAGHDSGDESGSEASGDERPPPRDPDVVRSTRKHKERPMSFSGMGDVKSRFEGGVRRQPAQDETKGELAKMRGMICGAREHKLAYEEALKEQEALSESKRSHEDASLVVQGNLRASYERAVQEAESPRSASRESPDGVPRGQAASITSRFERGEVATDEMATDEVAQQNGTTAAQDGAEEVTSELADTTQAESSDVPTPAEHVADSELLHSDTTKRMLSKFKQMEKSTGKTDDEVSVHREKAHGNARQMLSKFREMQEKAQKEDLPDGPPPPKSFTPPPEEPIAPHSEDTEDVEDVNDPDIVRSSQKVPDEFLNKRTDQARSLRDKFETWEPRAEKDPAFSVEEDCKPTLEITRNLRAKFESLKEQPKPVDKPQHKASRFIMEPNQAAEICGTCNKRVYAMEKLEVDKRILHKNCFRCSKCNCVLRMDTYTFNAGKLFCTPHFKQMFKTKGNYDEGFGVESRTKNWSNGHVEAATSNGETSAASRSDVEPAGTNGVKHTANGDSESAHGSDGSVEPELEPQLDDGPVTVVADDAGGGADADVFQQVYESALAEAI